MIESLALKLFSYIKRNKKLDYDDEIYIYGLEAIISTITDTLIILITALMLNAMSEALVFLVVFPLIRLFTGGYHAKTYLGCGVAIIITFLIYVCLVKLVQTDYTALYSVIMWVFSLIIIFKYAPIDNENKPLDSAEKKIFGVKSRLSACLLFAISFISLFLFVFLSVTVTATVFMVSILMAIDILIKRR